MDSLFSFFFEKKKLESFCRLVDFFFKVFVKITQLFLSIFKEFSKAAELC